MIVGGLTCQLVSRMISVTGFDNETYAMQIQTTEQVCEIFKISRSTLYRLSKNDPTFPVAQFAGTSQTFVSFTRSNDTPRKNGHKKSPHEAGLSLITFSS